MGRLENLKVDVANVVTSKIQDLIERAVLNPRFLSTKH
jgi:hypothetical protein